VGRRLWQPPPQHVRGGTKENIGKWRRTSSLYSTQKLKGETSKGGNWVKMEIREVGERRVRLKEAGGTPGAAILTTFWPKGEMSEGKGENVRAFRL